ncbi:MAG: Fic family protein [Planctomycetota bacterium]
MPVHISARAKDLKDLFQGLIDTYELLKNSEYDPVLEATIIAFGFVFIHPFVDGNGRLHRYLFHHILAERAFGPPGLVFPVSAAILERLGAYKSTLDHFSKPRLDLTDWRLTIEGNVKVLNETADFFRYFDASKQAEFLCGFVEETVTKTLPEEVNYLAKHDEFSRFIKNLVDMPDRLVDLTTRFLRQNSGRLSKRDRTGELKGLTDEEVGILESKFAEIFGPE